MVVNQSPAVRFTYMYTDIAFSWDIASVVYELVY